MKYYKIILIYDQKSVWEKTTFFISFNKLFDQCVINYLITTNQQSLEKTIVSLDERKRNSTNFPYLKFNPIQDMGEGGS